MPDNLRFQNHPINTTLLLTDPFIELLNQSICLRELAEGVVSEPLLPSGDQGRKGGFATLQKQPPIALGITNGIPYENRLYYGNLGCKAGRELGDFQELGTRPDKTKQAVLACLKTALGCSCGKWFISLSA